VAPDSLVETFAAVSLDIDGDYLLARVTHEDDADDDSVILADLDDPGIASKVPAELFDEFEELMAERGDAIAARASSPSVTVATSFHSTCSTIPARSSIGIAPASGLCLLA
jgi:hypothetical protein